MAIGFYVIPLLQVVYRFVMSLRSANYLIVTDEYITKKGTLSRKGTVLQRVGGLAGKCAVYY
jgi:hypothetical protein